MPNSYKYIKGEINVPSMRGRKQTFTYGNDSLSITELLQKPEIVGYLEKDGPLTYGSQREKLRKLLREGRVNPRMVMEHAARNPTAPRVQDTRYGTQRRRANLPRKTTRGEVLFGPEPSPRVPRRPRSAIIINGENLTVRQVLERYPQIRGFFNLTGEFQRSPYTQRCERGSGRERSHTASSTQNPRSFPGEGCWETTWSDTTRSTPRVTPRRRTF